MSVELLKQQFETISRSKGVPPYKEILRLGQTINESISNVRQSISKVKPSRSIFSFSKRSGSKKVKRNMNKLKNLTNLKTKVNTLTAKNMFSKHRNRFLNTVHEENRRGYTERAKRKHRLSQFALNKIREHRTPSRSASRSRASRSRASRSASR